MLLVVLSECVGSGELDTAVDDSGCCLPLTCYPSSTSCQCGCSARGTIECDVTTGIINVYV